MEWKYPEARILYAVPHSCSCLALREKKEPRVSDVTKTSRIYWTRNLASLRQRS